MVCMGRVLAPAGRCGQRIDGRRRGVDAGISRLLIANRGEVAIRIARAAGDLGIPTVGVFAADDTACLHVRRVDVARPLAGRGPRAYLDAEALLALARETACDAVHPGYGFLSEQAGFARRCL